ncbi:FAD/NAD(P)-binding domain-containing protein, partial [Polyporus arcularius HHB13444]
MKNTILLFASIAGVLQHGSLSSASSQEPMGLPHDTQCAPPNRIAVIGAGAAGSSAAFWLAKAAERNGLDVEVDVYDKNAYIGGRSTTVQPYNDPSLEPTELGGSVFVPPNKLIWRATEEYGFERFPFENSDDVMGVWDGSQFVVTVGGNYWYSSWWSKLKIVWKYGINAPTRTQAAVDGMVNTILKLYRADSPRFRNISSLASELGWTNVAGQTSLEYLRSSKVDDLWSLEFVEALTRLNYGQDIDRLHALEGLVTLAANGAKTVKGGNRQIFERFMRDSGATVSLNTRVKSVSRESSTGPWLVHTDASEEGVPYRAVILAAPFHQTGIEFASEPPIAAVPVQSYIHLHVTLLTTTSPSANATYFNLPLGHKVPEMVLTTRNGARQGGPEPEFNSLSYLRPVRKRDLSPWTNEQGQTEWVVKIFSKQRISDEWLESMFDGKVGWVLRKEWDAYPVLSPTSEFPPVILAGGLYYVNAFEPYV